MQDKEFRNLLEKYTSGNANEEEKAWLENAYLHWNEVERSVPDDKLFAHALTDMERHVMNATKPYHSIRMWTKIATVAATLLLISSLGWLYFYKGNNNTQIEISAASVDLAPGTEKAVLILANGREINLNDAKDGTLAAEQAGLKITKTDDGAVRYEQLAMETDAPIRYNTIKTPAGGKYKVILEDGTKVWLNASSSLTYPTSFASAAVREVNLKGEGYFEVSKRKEADLALPFVVVTAKQQVRVLGTHFNVNAYEDEVAAVTTLIEGSVKINDQFLLKPDQQALSTADVTKVRTVHATDYIDWKTGEFNLNSSDFRVMMRKIARWYDVEIVYEETAPERIKLGGWISRDKNISSILNIMQGTGKVHFKLEGRRVTVSK